MKPPIKNICLLLAFSAIFIHSSAQNAAYTTKGGITLGVGIGAAYQKSDIANSIGAGFDAWLGTPLYKKEHAFFQVDWKFRFLAGENIAYDHRINTDSTYSNLLYRFYNYDFELGLTLNRLRERTRIVLTGFAGIGITHGHTFTDLYDANHNLYDFSGINPALDNRQIHSDLVALSDGDFETSLVNKAAVLPTVGIYLGYQFTRSFSMGLQHKINFSLSEGNGLFGINMDNRIMPGSGIDMNHYTALVFRWSLGGGGRASRTYTSYQDQPVHTSNLSDSLRKMISTTQPGPDYQPDTTVTSFSVTTPPRVNTNITTRPLPTTQTVTTTQTTTTTVPTTTVITTTGGRSTPMPEVRFVNPESPVTVESNIFRMRAQTRHVARWQDVDVTVNGVPNSFYSFSPQGVVTLNVVLREGENRIDVTGENEAGKVTGVTTITYHKPVVIPPPQVTVLIPSVTPFNSEKESEQVEATVEGVSSRNDISLNVNGSASTAFSFDPNTLTLQTKVTLREGSNRITITARNASGEDRKTVEIIKSTPPCPAPVLRILEPAISSRPVRTAEVTFRASVRNVTNRNQLRLRLNGAVLSGFGFDGQEVKASVALRPGSNRFELFASNQCGSDNATRPVIYQPEVVEVPCTPPAIDFTIQESGSGMISLQGKISNVTSKNDITLTVNGSADAGFQFNAQTGEISRDFNFSPGTYSVNVIASNACGKTNQAVSVTVAAPCTPPAVNFTINKSGSGTVTHTLRGTVSNVTSKNQIKLTVNGSADAGFRFNAQTGEITRDFSFNPGTYTVNVAVSNDCGNNNKTVSITVGAPCTPPAVNFTINKAGSGTVTHTLRGTVSNVTSKNQVKLTVNGSSDAGFRFNAQTGEISRDFTFSPGTYRVNVAASNDCGNNNKTVSVTVAAPCTPPAVNFTINKSGSGTVTHTLRGTVSNVTGKNQIKLTVNGSADAGFRFNAQTGEITRDFTFSPGTYSVNVAASNDCGNNNKTLSVTVAPPCIPPTVSFSVAAVENQQNTHTLKGTVKNVTQKSEIKLSVDGTNVYTFSFNGNTGAMSAGLRLATGTHTIVVTATNACGKDAGTQTVTVAAPAPVCGTRINPGNAAWQFCLVTPKGTYNRTNLSNKNFSYKGPAGSLYIMPTAGGGTAIVNGKAYKLNPGEYYLFSGTMTVEVTSRHQGAMGQWWVCVTSGRAPVHGKGNNRPKSPCESAKDNKGNSNASGKK